MRHSLHAHPTSQLTYSEDVQGAHRAELVPRVMSLVSYSYPKAMCNWQSDDASTCVTSPIPVHFWVPAVLGPLQMALVQLCCCHHLSVLYTLGPFTHEWGQQLLGKAPGGPPCS
jgi:hypothetical protein